MNLIHSLFYLLSFSLFSWLVLLLFFNYQARARILVSGVLGAFVFQLVNYIRIGYIDPFVFFVAILSFVCSLFFSILFESVFTCFLNRGGGD